MAIRWKVVATGGHVVITAGAAAGGASLYDGTGIENASLSVRKPTSDFRVMEAASAQRIKGDTEYRITLTKGLEDARITGQTEQSLIALALQDEMYAVFYDANDTLLFAGVVTYDDLGDSQRVDDAARQSITLINSGNPVTPAAAADPATWPYIL